MTRWPVGELLTYIQGLEGIHSMVFSGYGLRLSQTNCVETIGLLYQRLAQVIIFLLGSSN